LKSTAIITAAGYGRRVGGQKKKQFLLLGGVPILVHTLEKFQSSNLITDIILIAPNEDIEFCKKEFLLKYNFTKLKKIVSGGKKRQDSVSNGLKEVSQDTEIIVVHDGVRPFISSRLLETSIKEAIKKGAAVAAIPVNDTLKKISAQGMLENGLNRDSIWRIQTPQVFKKEILIHAFEKARQDDFYGTDESSLVARIGNSVHIVKGSELNIKITTPEDMILAESIFHSLQKFKKKPPAQYKKTI